jgi:hypothetical protein
MYVGTFNENLRPANFVRTRTVYFRSILCSDQCDQVGRLFALGSFLIKSRTQSSGQLFRGKSCVIILTKNGLGLI